MRDNFFLLYLDEIYTPNLNIRDFRQVILDIFIVNKKQNHAGLQLADLILYPTYDGIVENHNTRNDHLIDFDKIIKKKLYKGMSSITLFP